jgi:5-methylcytosine-specific restriction protein A
VFEVGREYRRIELLDFVGSRQARSGIIWGPKQPGCVIVTSGGKHSKRAGYEDKRNPDGCWLYFGQGKKGDQDPNRYANRLLVEGRRSVLFFTTREPPAADTRRRGDYSKRYRFEGMYGVRAWEWHVTEAGSRAGDRLLLFHLVPTQGMYGLQLGVAQTDDTDAELDILDEVSFRELRAIVLAKNRQPPQLLSVRAYRRASTQIKVYAKLRANGVCEYCGKPAPFVDSLGSPFLEVHHLERLADDGPGTPYNVAALCPNCHREVHFGRELDRLKEELKQRILSKEHNLGGTLPSLK